MKHAFSTVAYHTWIYDIFWQCHLVMIHYLLPEITFLQDFVLIPEMLKKCFFVTTSATLVLPVDEVLRIHTSSVIISSLCSCLMNFHPTMSFWSSYKDVVRSRVSILQLVSFINSCTFAYLFSNINIWF